MRIDHVNSRGLRLCDVLRLERGSSKIQNMYPWSVLRTDLICRLISFTSFIFISLVATGCVGNNYPELTSSQELDKTAYEYSIGTGDILNIFVWGYPDLDESVPVRPDGKITTKLVEDLLASGRTPSDLARDIEDAYSSFVPNPIVTISLAQFSGSQNQQVKIVSAGSDARTIPYTNELTLLDVIIEIGGLTEFADGNSAVLVRKEQDKSKNYSLRIDDLIRKGDISANVDIKPGDIVLIPERWF